jgi:hypothetical protein
MRGDCVRAGQYRRGSLRFEWLFMTFRTSSLYLSGFILSDWPGILLRQALFPLLTPLFFEVGKLNATDRDRSLFENNYLHAQP